MLSRIERYLRDSNSTFEHHSFEIKMLNWNKTTWLVLSCLVRTYPVFYVCEVYKTHQRVITLNLGFQYNYIGGGVPVIMRLFLCCILLKNASSVPRRLNDNKCLAFEKDSARVKTSGHKHFLETYPNGDIYPTGDQYPTGYLYPNTDLYPNGHPFVLFWLSSIKKKWIICHV